MNPFRPSSRAALLACTLFGAAAAPGLHGQIESVTRLTAAPQRYARVDFVVMLTAGWQDPYRSADVRLDLTLIAPSGRKLSLPGYYERGESGRPSIWRLRFAPQEAGRYEGSVALAAAGQPAGTLPVSFDVAPSAAKGFLHPAGPWGFRFDNGEFFRGIGENIGWEARTFDDSRHLDALNENPRYNYEYLLGSLHAAGGNFFRTWMCPWNLPLEWKHPSNSVRYTDDPAHFNASAIRRMDDLVELATSTDTYFMLAIDAHGSLLGHSWKTSSYNAKNGGPAHTPAEFFTNPTARAQFKDRLRYLVARWGWSPHLAVWEFFNEVDNAMYGQKPDRIPDAVVTAWHAEMAAYLKELDCYGHVVTTSISHREVAGLDDIAAMDLNQRHIYGDTDAIPDTIRRRLREHGKPYAIGEFSYEWDWTKNFDDFAPQMDHDFKHGLWLGLFSPTPILPMSWWWEYFDHRRVTPYLARVRRIDEEMLAAGGGDFHEVELTWSGAVLRHLLGVRCGQSTFALLSNTSGAAISGRLALPADAPGARVRIYDPAQDRFSEAAADGSTVVVTVPANEDVVVIVDR